MKDQYDFSKGVRNPYAGKFIKNGRFTAEIERAGYNEIVEYDTNTNEKRVIKLILNDSRILIEDNRIGV